MDHLRFDKLTKVFAQGFNRRSLAKWAVVGVAGGVATGFESADAQCGGTTSFCGGSNPPCCPGLQCAGSGGLMTCQNCGGAGAFCGGGNPTCCNGYICTGPGPLTCQGNGGSTGEPHLTTFGGLLYDFQATGDFVLLARRDPDFLVQARQVPFAPNPQLAVNSGVAARIADIEVAVCLGDNPLMVKGQPADLADRQTLFLPNGVTITRAGNRYVIAGNNGDSVSATVYDANIDVAVGNGTELRDVDGLLGGPSDPLGIKTSDGTILNSPFAFGDLYGQFADGWRVDASESLLTVCGPGGDPGRPDKPFGTDDLDPADAERARDFCVQLEVAEGLLDACTLDVASMGDRAVQAYSNRPNPNQVGEIVP